MCFVFISLRMVPIPKNNGCFKPFWEDRNSVCIFPNKIWEAPFTHGATSPRKNEDAENHGRFPSKKITILGLLALIFKAVRGFAICSCCQLQKIWSNYSDVTRPQKAAEGNLGW